MRWALLFVLSLVLTQWTAAAQAGSVGSATLVKNSVTGKLGGKTRKLRRGNEVYQRELIATAHRSLARLTFLDKTKLTMGANSSVRLTTFVFNPAKRRGKLALNVTKGAFRFISGVARPSGYRIKTPLASTGVRGTTIDGYVDSRRRFDLLILRKGAMVVCGAGKCVSANKPGTYVLVKMNGNVAKGRWGGALQPLIRKHMYQIFPAKNRASTNAVLRDFKTSFGSLR